MAVSMMAVSTAVRLPSAQIAHAGSLRSISAPVRSPITMAQQLNRPKRPQQPAAGKGGGSAAGAGQKKRRRSKQRRHRAAGLQMEEAGELAGPPEGGEVPRLVVFDLDDTVWFPEMYMISGAPFTKEDGRVYDRRGTEVRVYPAAAAALELVHKDPRFGETKVAFASRSNKREWCFDCMRLLEVGSGLSILDTSSQTEIYSGSKRAHFAEIRKRSGVPFNEMLFFDNERLNITEVSQLGVTCLYTPGGMSEGFWAEGLDLYARNRASF